MTTNDFILKAFSFFNLIRKLNETKFKIKLILETFSILDSFSALKKFLIYFFTVIIIDIVRITIYRKLNYKWKQFILSLFCQHSIVKLTYLLLFSKCLYRIHDLVLSEFVHSIEWNLWRLDSRPLVNYWTNLSPTRVQDGPLPNVIKTLATTEIGDLTGHVFGEKWLNWYCIENMTPIIKKGY